MKQLFFDLAPSDITREQAKQAIFSSMESYYNKKRMHSSIDYKTPYEMEFA